MYGTELALALTIAAVIFAAAFISSIAGFAFSALAGAALVYVLQDPVRTVAILTACSIGIHGYCAWRVRRDVEWRTLGPFLLAGALTVPLGVWLLACIPANHFAAGLGAFLLAYGAYMILCRKEVVVGPSTAADATVGGLGGLLAGLAGFAGASVTVWCGLRGWSKERQRALCQPFILFMQVEALALVGATRPAALPAETFYLYLPVALLAACTGVGLVQRMSTRQFNLVVRLLLIASGAALIGPALL